MIGVCSVAGIPLVTVIRKTVMVSIVEIAKETWILSWLWSFKHFLWLESSIVPSLQIQQELERRTLTQKNYNLQLLSLTWIVIHCNVWLNQSIIEISEIQCENVDEYGRLNVVEKEEFRPSPNQQIVPGSYHHVHQGDHGDGLTWHQQRALGNSWEFSPRAELPRTFSAQTHLAQKMNFYQFKTPHCSQL